MTLQDEASFIKILYQYLISSGNFDVRVDFSAFSANDNTDAPTAYFVIQDGVGTDRAEIRYTLNADGTTHEVRSLLRCNNNNQYSSIVNPASRPTMLRITRVGNVISIYYFVSGWQLLDSRDYGALAANLNQVALAVLSGDTANGGYIEFDNLDFLIGCPGGYPKAWTSTSSTTTTTTQPPGE